MTSAPDGLCPCCGSSSLLHTPNGGSELFIECLNCDHEWRGCWDDADDLDDEYDGPSFVSSARQRTRMRREYGTY